MKCTLCNERNGNTRCEGCNTLFCLVCMNKHHDELVQQFQLLMNVRNEVKELITPNETRITCLDTIDQWETVIIQRIQQIAAKARTNVNEILTGHMNAIRHRFEELSEDMLRRQKEGNYLENDIERVKNQLDQLKNDIEHVSENIQVDTTLSNNIEWETLIYVAEADLSTSKSIRINNRVAPSLSSRIERTESKRLSSSRIPVHVENSSSSVTNRNLFDFERTTDLIEKCIICNRLFVDLSPTRICSECNQKMRYGAPRQSDVIRPKATNKNRPAYEPDFAPVVSSTSSRIIRCPRCKYLNSSTDEMSGSDFYCSVCRNVIPI